MPTYQFLDLSTSHLSEEEMQVLAAQDDLDDDFRVASRGCLPRVIRHRYGAWVNVPPAADDDAQDTRDRQASFPNLQRVIDHARAADCTWINFDRDADVDALLPTFEW